MKLNRMLSFRLGFFPTKNYTDGIGLLLNWILTTGFWVDDNIWLDEALWNDGV
jgi:hypothetical protein